jgi:hypothetical protein
MKKTSLVFISMVILFSFNIALVKADTNFVAAVINSNRTPVVGAKVLLYKDGNLILGYFCYIEDTGFCNVNFSPGLDASTLYWAGTDYPNNPPFGSTWAFITDAYGNGKVTICPDGFSMPECDAIPPEYSNANGPGSVYSPTEAYNFNITWTDENAIDKVFIEIGNSTNVLVNNASMTNSGGNSYTYSINLPAGTWYWKSYANDTANNWASTDNQAFTISKATPSLSCSGTSNTYPSSISFSGSGCPSQGASDVSCTLTNPTPAGCPSCSGSSCNILCTAGTYSSTYTSTSGQNWSSSTSSSCSATQNKGTPTLSLTSSKSITYGTAAGMTGSTSDSGNGGCTYTLYRNGSSYGSGTSVTDNTVLAAGSYPYVYNTSGCTNYTSGTTTTSTLTVNRASPSLSLSRSGGWSYIYNPSTQAGVQASESNTGDSDCIYNFYRNNTGLINSGGHPYSYTDNTVLAAGAYLYTLNNSQCTNYSAGTTSNTLTISKGSRTADVVFDQTSPINYETLLTANCSVDNGASDGNWKLYRNGTDVTAAEKGIPTRYGANTYNFTCSITGGANWTDASKQEIFTVNPKNANVKVYPTNQTYTYPYTATQYCTDDSTLLNCNIYRNETPILNNTQYSPAAGVYVYKANISDTVNYTNYQDTENLTINKAMPTFSTSVTTPITYGTASNYTGSESNSGDSDCIYYLLRNGIQLYNGSSVSDNAVLGAGNYNYTYYTSGCTNYTFGKDEKTLVVNKAIPIGSLTSDKGWNVYVGTTVTIGYSESNSGDGDVTYKVWRDGVDKGSGETWTPSIGSYAYKLNTTDGQNYSARDSIDTKTLVVSNKIPSNCSLKSSSGWTYTYPTATTLSCSCIGDGTTHLYVDNVQKDSLNNTAITFAAKPSGYYVVCNITEGTNYQSSTNSSTLFVNKASRTCTLATDKGWTRTYNGTSSSTTCSVSAASTDGTMSFTKNSNTVSTPDSQTNAGAFNYACQWTGGVNYSDCTQQINTLTINKATSICTLTSSSGWSYTYGTSTTLTCSCKGDGTTNLYFNGALHNDYNNSARIFAANPSGYSVVCNITEGTNYASAMNSSTLTISKTTPSININILPSETVTYPTQTNTSCSISSINNEVTPQLFRNGTSVSNPDVVTLPIGSYVYVCNNTGTQNYTTGQAQKTLVVSSVSVPVITILSPNSTVYYYKLNISLNFAISNNASQISWIGYSLNKTLNVTISGPVNMTGLANGWDNITVFANDSFNNMGSSFVNFFYCLGDVSGSTVGVPDGKVDISDVAFVSKKFGAYLCGNRSSSFPVYDPRVDMNDDCRIDITDVAIVAKKFGTKCK